MLANICNLFLSFVNILGGMILPNEYWLIKEYNWLQTVTGLFLLTFITGVLLKCRKIKIRKQHILKM